MRVNGTEIRKSTKIPHTPTDGTTPKQAERLAQEAADKMELAARGNVCAAAASLRAQAAALEKAAGMAQHVTIRAFLERVEIGGQFKAREDNRRTFSEFLAWLADEADTPAASLNWKTCLAFLGHLLRQGLALSTVGLKRGHLSTAWRKAVRDDIAAKNPWEYATMDEARRIYAPELKTGKKSEREPFTMEEMKHILTQFPQPWQDVAALSFYTGGQRLGDCCKLAWQAVDLERQQIDIQPQKSTKKKRLLIPIHPALLPRLQRRRKEAQENAVFVFPELAAVMGQTNNTAPLASAFVALLKSFGIIPAVQARKDGRGHNMAKKSFHSIRHTVSSTLAASGVPESVGMAIVGHDDKDIHAAYVTIGQEDKKKAMLILPDFGE